MAKVDLTSDLFLNKLRQWNEAKDLLDKTKVMELQLRNEIVKDAYPDKKALAEGTTNFDLPGNWKLKIVTKVSVTIDVAALDAVKEALKEAGISPDLIFEDKPSFVKTEYKKLDKEQQKIVNEALTFKDAAPTIELVAPKA